MNSQRITLRQAIKFHGHLGPWLILGILMGELALEKLKAKKYFGLKVKVWGINKKPKSCLIDGLQLSTGATYGKGNIQALNGTQEQIEFYNLIKKKKIILKLKSGLIRKLQEAKTHRDCELLARNLYKTEYSQLFNIIT